MLSIQDAGNQILNNNPGKFYIFIGEEYGVKEKYIECIKRKYNGLYTEISEFQIVHDLMKTRHILPLDPQLYIIRYDETFISALKESTANLISKLKIIGTVVMVYQDGKSSSKCEKFLPDYTVSFDRVSSAFVKKYLTGDYPDLDSHHIDLAIRVRDDYKGAKLLCGLLSLSDKETLSKYDDCGILYTFYGEVGSIDEQIKLGVASKNFEYLINIVEDYPGNFDSIFYIMLSTLLELDKLKSRNYMDSSIKPYLGYWNRSDIYNMFVLVYNSINLLRTISSDAYSELLFLFGVMQYQRIPELSYFDS